MSEGLRAVTAALASASIRPLIEAPDDVFLENELPVVQFVRQHFRRHRSMPDATTVQTECGVRLPAAPEPLLFYVDRLFERHQYNIIRDRFGEMREALTTRDMPAITEAVGEMHRAGRLTQRQGRELANLREASDQMFSRLAETQGYGGITGIETGWSQYDRITGGYQNGDLITMVGRPGTGKCMDPSTEVVMATGQLRKIGDLKAGDRLMGPDSQPRTVLTTIRGRDPMYRVTGTGGEPFVCNGAHILVLACDFDVNETYRKGGSYLMSVDEYLALAPRVQRKLRLVRTAVEFPASDVEVSPYYVGVWLGDGCRANGRISTVDPEIVAAVHDEARRFGVDVVQCESRPGMCPQYALVNGRGKDHVVLDFFRSDCMRSGEKRIPTAYLWNGTEVRMQLLAGMLDTDGHLASDTAFEFITKWASLRDDFMYLCRSLGFRAKASVKVVNGAEYHRVYLTGALHNIPTRLPRKKASPYARRFPVEHASFTVEPLGEGEYAGITLDKDHLYLLRDFTVTHNTYVALKQAKAAHDAGHSVLVITTEMPTEQLLRRHASIALGINPMLLKMNMISTHTLRRMERFYQAHAAVEGFNIFSVGMRSNTSAVEAMMQELMPDFIVVDGLYLLKPSNTKGNMSRTERITMVLDEIKGLTLDANRPILATTQFSRGAGKAGVDGSLENIGYTDAIGTHSSAVAAIKYGPTTNPKASRWLEFLKGRDGEDGRVAINFKFAPTNLDEIPFEELNAMTGEGTGGTAAPGEQAANVDWMSQ